MSENIRNLADGGAGPKKNGFDRWIGGRARRREYWVWMAPLMLLQLSLGVAQMTVFAMMIGLPVLLIWIRRLHDLGHSGWVAPVINIAVNVASFAARGFLPPMPASWVALLAYAGAVVALGALPGEPRNNEYGPPPGGRRERNLAETFS